MIYRHSWQRSPTKIECKDQMDGCQQKQRFSRQSTDISKNGEIVERVQKNKYLCCSNETLYLGQEIESRNEQARTSFKNMQKVLANRALRIPLRGPLLHCCVFSILLYRVETWTLTEAIGKRIEAFEMWTYRIKLRISWMKMVTNEAVLQRMSRQKEVLNTNNKDPKYNLFLIIIQKIIEESVVLAGNFLYGRLMSSSERAHKRCLMMMWSWPPKNILAQESGMKETQRYSLGRLWTKWTSYDWWPMFYDDMATWRGTSEETEIEQFYKDITTARSKKLFRTVIGDFNAKLGQTQQENIDKVGNFEIQQTQIVRDVYFDILPRTPLVTNISGRS